jgi:hypothetical protein
MHRANFCTECGERLSQKGWRALLGRRLCEHCSQRLASLTAYRSLVVIVLIVLGAFAFGRYLRPAPPPLIIQRAANSPLSDTPSQFAANATNSSPTENSNVTASTADDEVYICGARTKKGTPCRRRVHVAGERCFQHKGMPAMLALDKLVIKSTDQPK